MSQAAGVEGAAAPAAAAPAAAAAAAANSDGLADSDGCVSEVFVESTWRGAVLKYDREMQSEPLQTRDAAGQSRVMQSEGCQTESAPIATLSSDAPLPSTFGPFLHRVYPTLAAQLEANLSSRAFDEYGLEGEGGEADAIESLFALCHTQAVADLNRGAEEGSGGSVTSGGGRNKKASRGARGGLGLSMDPSQQGGAGVLGVSWSCNGSVLAAAYGCSNHSGWCNHSAATVAFWNIMRRQICSTAADFTIETECCCMCLAYHPERPTVVAGGMFNGEIRVWDTSLLEEGDAAAGGDGSAGSGGGGSGEACIMRSSIDDYFHREPITRLQWIRDSYTRSWNLASVAGDGKVLFWPAGAGLDAAAAAGEGGAGAGGLKCPIEGYVLQPNQIWHGQGVQRNRFQVLGGASVAFVQQPALQDGATGTGGGGSGASHYFVAATEGGGIVRVALSTIPRRKGYVKSGGAGGGSDSGLRWNRDAHRLVENADPGARFDLRKCVEKHVRSLGLEAVELEHVFQSRPPPLALYPGAINMAFEGHAGPAYGLEFNPAERRIFASAATDGAVKIYHINQSKPLLTLECGSSYLFSLAWSPSRPLVLAVGTGDGTLLVYDLLVSMMAPAATITVNGDRTPLHALAFSGVEGALLACADIKGRVHVWNLGARYATMQPGEKKLIQQMGNMNARQA